MDEHTMIGEGGLIPAGRYQARALPETAVFGKASTDTEQIAMSFEILEGRFKGTKLPWYGYFSDGAKARTLEALITAGCTFPGDDLGDLTGLGSTEVEIETELSENPNSGALRARVNWVNTPGAVVMKATYDESEKKAFSKRVKDDLLAAKKKAGIGKKPAAASNASAAK